MIIGAIFVDDGLACCDKGKLGKLIMITTTMELEVKEGEVDVYVGLREQEIDHKNCSTLIIVHILIGRSNNSIFKMRILY